MTGSLLYSINIWTVRMQGFGALQSFFRSMIRDRLPNWNPTFSMCDFEYAAIAAFNDNFPNTRKSGCLFHLGQSLWRYVNENCPTLRQEFDNVLLKYL